MRGMPGGSQYRCTGSFVLSNVCSAPKGGRALLNFSAAQGVIGACSGCLANGSDESQVLSRMPSGPWKSGSQMPERSGMPLAIRPGFGAFASAGTAAVCAEIRGAQAAAAMNPTIQIAVRIRITISPGCMQPYSDRPGSGCPLTTVFRMKVIVLVIPTGAPFLDGCVSITISSPAFIELLLQPARTMCTGDANSMVQCCISPPSL